MVVFAEPRARAHRRARRPVKHDRAARQRDVAEVRVIDHLHHAARAQVFVRHHLSDAADRGGGDLVLRSEVVNLVFRMAARPRRDEFVDLGDRGDAPLVGREARLSGEVVASHRVQQITPVLVAHDDDRHPAVRRRVGVVGGHRQAAVPVSRPCRHRAVVCGVHADRRGQHRIDGLDHRDLDRPSRPGALAFVQRGDDPAVQVRPGEKIADRGTRLRGRPVDRAGRLHHAAHRLDREVHPEQVAVGPARAVAGRRRVDEPGIPRRKNVDARAEPFEDAGCEVLEQDVGPLHELQEHLDAARVFEVERHRLFVRVEHTRAAAT